MTTQRPDPDAVMISRVLAASGKPMTTEMLVSAANAYAALRSNRERTSAPADHPHTDPGDGRTECQPCGKYVWPVIHSCKGVPVTARARARAGLPPEVTRP